MIRTETTDLRNLRDELATLAKDMRKEMRVALKAAAKKGRSEAAKAAATIIRQPQKNLKRAVYYKINGERVEVVIRGKHRIALRHFKPRQTKSGIKVKPYKTPERYDERRDYDKGFMGSRPGRFTVKFRGQPMQRIGQERLPIDAMRAVHVTEDLLKHPAVISAMVQDMSGVTKHQLERRIRYLRLKAKGGLRGRQPT